MSAINPDNTIVSREDWVTQLQLRLSEPNKWKDICNVEYTNSKVLNNPYLTDPTVQTGSRGTPYSMQAITETNESITINTFKILAQIIDRADLSQSGYLKQMEMADRQAVLLNESIESAVLFPSGLTTFDNTELGGSAGSITVSANNVDDIITNVQRKINAAKGQTLLDRNGGFIVWRPADFQLLQTFVMANGFQSADQALRNGVTPTGGFDYMGFTHYSSNLLSGGHILAGVKKLLHLGILKDTYGQIVVNPYDPGQVSGISVTSRVDFAVKVWNKVSTVLLDVRAV